MFISNSLTMPPNSRKLNPMESFDFFQPVVFTVTALNAYLRELLETDEVLQDLWVRGEISNFSQPRSGHLYFTLKIPKPRCAV